MVHCAKADRALARFIDSLFERMIHLEAERSQLKSWGKDYWIAMMPGKFQQIFFDADRRTNEIRCDELNFFIKYHG